jgi:lysozyme
VFDLLKGLIRRFEGCRLLAYLCPAGVWTIGWGATGPQVKPGVRWSQEEADTALDAMAVAYAREAGGLSPVLLLHPEAHAAIADFVYNLGSTRYKASTLRRRVAAQDWEGAREELAKWVWGGGKKLPGLVLRRAAEAALLPR